MNLGEPAISLRGPVYERKARRRHGPCGCLPERGNETETREEAYGDPIPQNVNYIDQKSKSISMERNHTNHTILHKPQKK